MHFSIVSILAALAPLAMANTVKFINQGTGAKDIIFTAATGSAALATVTLAGSGTYTQQFPIEWQGNWYLVPHKSAPIPGMLGEIQFQGWEGLNYFDVSAIVDPMDWDGVKEIFPASAQLPMSGCQTFPCSNCYNEPDDIATLSTTEDDFICLVGTAGNVRRHARQFVAGTQA